MIKPQFIIYLFSMLAYAQISMAQADCYPPTDRPDQVAYLPNYVDSSEYDRNWYTQRDMLHLITAALEPRAITGDRSKWLNLQYVVDQEGKFIDFMVRKEENADYIPIIVEALADFPALQPAMLDGKPVCSIGRLSIALTKSYYPGTEELKPELLYQMPLYQPTACANLPKHERRNCSNMAILNTIYQNIRYPDIARTNGIEGTVVITFNINKEGKPEDFRIARDIGGSCGQEALRVAQNYLTNWSPGLDENRQAVKVQFNLPVKFRLEGSQEAKQRKKESKKNRKKRS